jgi:hypothetical protein
MFERCPYCDSMLVTWNWFYSEVCDTWGHECWECDNVFETYKKSEEESLIQ